MTKDELTTKFIEMSEKNISAFNGLEAAINKINDTNALHSIQTKEMGDHIEKLVSGVESISKLFGRIIWALTVALIVLAGAEKVLKFM